MVPGPVRAAAAWKREDEEEEKEEEEDDGEEGKWKDEAGFVIGKRNQDAAHGFETIFPNPTADNYLVRQSRTHEQQTSVYT